MIVVEAAERRRAVIHFSIDTPETRQEFKINVNHLLEGLGIFQKLIRYGYKKALSHLTFQNRQLLDKEIHYGIEVFSFSHSSFTVHLQSESFADIFGYVEVEKALRKIDEIMNPTEINEDTIQVFRKNRGLFLSAYKQLLEYIIKNDSPIYYEWVIPEIVTPVKHSISKKTATVFYGERKIADCYKWLKGEIFEPLKNHDCFQKFFVDGWTISWPNGADISPEALYDESESTEQFNRPVEHSAGLKPAEDNVVVS